MRPRVDRRRAAFDGAQYTEGAHGGITAKSPGVKAWWGKRL
jgi:hypothetical protein